MHSDFHDSHIRHWEDAEFLNGSGRWANADQLYGLSTECGLKRLMQAFGMQLDPQGVPQDRADKVHADLLWVRYPTYIQGHVHGVGYPLSSSNPFSNWSASQRYAARSNFNPGLVASHQTGANEVRQLVLKACRDGIIC
jgi:hypothetical protein